MTSKNKISNSSTITTTTHHSKHSKEHTREHLKHTTKKTREKIKINTKPSGRAFYTHGKNGSSLRGGGGNTTKKKITNTANIANKNGSSNTTALDLHDDNKSIFVGR